jgi:hypothetical protein
MIRYRITQKNIICDGMTEEEARDALMQIKDSRPSEIFDVEEYNWAPDSRRLGRDPDLH